jgi:hypothetical protein
MLLVLKYYSSDRCIAVNGARTMFTPDVMPLLM